MLDTHSIWCFSQYTIILYSTSIYVVHVVPLKKTSAMKRLEPSKQETTMLGVAWRCLFQDVLSPYIFTIMYMIINIYIYIYASLCLYAKYKIKTLHKSKNRLLHELCGWLQEKTIIMIWIPPHFPVTCKYTPVYSGSLRGYMQHCCVSHLNCISFDQTKLLKSEKMWHVCWWYFEVPKSLNREHVILLMEESWDGAKTL